MFCCENRFRSTSNWILANRTDFNLCFYPNVIGEQHAWIEVSIECKWLILLKAFAPSIIKRSIRPEVICQLIPLAPAAQEIPVTFKAIHRSIKNVMKAMHCLGWGIWLYCWSGVSREAPQTLHKQVVHMKKMKTNEKCYADAWHRRTCFRFIFNFIIQRFDTFTTHVTKCHDQWLVCILRCMPFTNVENRSHPHLIMVHVLDVSNWRTRAIAIR